MTVSPSGEDKSVYLEMLLIAKKANLTISRYQKNLPYWISPFILRTISLKLLQGNVFAQ
jgi:hypothetical protein